LRAWGCTLPDPPPPSASPVSSNYVLRIEWCFDVPFDGAGLSRLLARWVRLCSTFSSMVVRRACSPISFWPRLDGFPRKEAVKLLDSIFSNFRASIPRQPTVLVNGPLLNGLDEFTPLPTCFPPSSSFLSLAAWIVANFPPFRPYLLERGGVTSDVFASVLIKAPGPFSPPYSLSPSDGWIFFRLLPVNSLSHENPFPPYHSNRFSPHWSSWIFSSLFPNLFAISAGHSKFSPFLVSLPPRFE